MYDHVTIRDILGRTLGRVRDDGYVEPAEGCSGKQMAVATADQLFDQLPARSLAVGDGLSLALAPGWADTVTFRDGTITLRAQPPGTEETLAFWRELDRRIAREWTQPRRELV